MVETTLQLFVKKPDTKSLNGSWDYDFFPISNTCIRSISCLRYFYTRLRQKEKISYCQLLAMHSILFFFTSICSILAYTSIWKHFALLRKLDNNKKESNCCVLAFAQDREGDRVLSVLVYIIISLALKSSQACTKATLVQRPVQSICLEARSSDDLFKIK